MKHPIKVIIAIPGLDGHERGAISVAMGPQNEGMEIIYTGPRQTVEATMNTCIQ